MTSIQHIAIIMDGNRRWAKQKNLPAKEGHKMGVETLEKVVKGLAETKIPYLTVYALSTENLDNRDRSEIKDLFSILKDGFIKKLPTLKKEGVRVKFFGNLEKLPLGVKRVLVEAEKQLKHGKSLQLNIAINYGSRAEILDAVGKLESVVKVDEVSLSRALYTKDIPDPDLIIRTGGQKRLSNFLLWQSAYAELYFTDKLWPEFNEEDLAEALEDFENRKRNFGT